MLTLALRGVRNNVGRYVATLVAILVGVAFFTATGFLSDRVIASLEGGVDAQYGNVDAAVTARETKDASGASTSFSDELRISGASAARIAAAPGVSGTGGVLTGRVAFLGADGKTFAKDATGRLWITDRELNPLEVVKGRAPKVEGEIAVDRRLSDHEGLAVGDRVTILTLAGPFEARVVGVTAFADADSIDSGGTVSIPKTAAFDWLSSGIPEYQSLYVRGSVDQSDLVRTLRPLVPDGYRVQSGDAFRADQRETIGSAGHFLKDALQGFALLALLVGAFVIYNTFSVIVAQRLRELAVLAAVGATPKQIKRSLRFEGLTIGIIGSALGVITGIGLTFLMILALEALGVDLPGSGIRIRSTTVLAGLLLGTIITVLSVMIPARRAAKTEPIEALRDAAVERPATSRRRVVSAVVLVVLGAVGLLFGGSAAAVGFGALLLFVGVIVSGPFIAIGGTKVLKPIMSHLGLEGRLAVDNTARNPQRTATTANALLIGVFLVTFVTVAGTNLKDFVVSEIQKLGSADYLVTSDGGTLDDQLVAKLEAIDGVEKVVPFRRESVTLDGAATILSTGDSRALARATDLDVTAGSLADLGPGAIAIVDSGGRKLVGDTVTVANNTGGSEDLRVVAVLGASIDSAQFGNLTSVESFDDLVGKTAPTVAFIDATSGDQTTTKDAIERATARRPDITVVEGNALGQLIGSVFDFLINAINGLLLMSVIIALIGIINTLSLSILERRRELGLLRVVGMTDHRIQRMVTLESVIIAALGTVSGLVIGLVVAFGMVNAIDRLSEADLSFGLPGLKLGLVLVLGLALGVLAALIPAKRSTRLEVLEAIQAT